MNALMHNGHRNENPRVPISTPYDMARKKKLMQIGSTLGNAALNARVFTPPIPLAHPHSSLPYVASPFATTMPCNHPIV